MSKVLVVNTKGGGHGFIGLYLARKLLQDGNTVDILQVGSESDKGPIGQYPKLASEYPSTFSVRYGEVNTTTVGNGYDAVYDNNAKSLDDIQPIIKLGKSGAEVFYISSAGAYVYDANVAPHFEGLPAKGPTIDVEEAIRGNGVSSVNFRPIYIIGPSTSKREYVDYFFDRIERERPLLLPGNGSELTSITDIRDIAAMLAAALGKGMKNETLNLANTRCISFSGMVKLCAEAVGKEAKIVNYNPKEAEKKVEGFKVKKAFPFRPRHFFADPGQAQMKLGWDAEYSGSMEGLQSTLKACYEEYRQLGLDKKDVDFSLDEKLLATVV